MRSIRKRARADWLAAVALTSALPGLASAGTIQPCDGNCTWAILAGGVQVANGAFDVDLDTGDIDFASPVKVGLGGGAWASIDSLTGNSDPILNFNVAAATGTNGRTFSFTFSLPVSLSGDAYTSSSAAYTLTSRTSVGAQLTPLRQHTVVAQDVDTTPGGLPARNAGVDVGDRFFFTGSGTHTSPTYTAETPVTASSAYDLMSVTLGFSLTGNTTAGVSGFVESVPIDQSPVPVPASVWLLGAALLGWLVFNRADTKLIHGGAKLRTREPNRKGVTHEFAAS